MAAIHIREVDDAVVEALKARASRNHRSLQGEIRSILEQAAGEETETGGSRARRRLRIRTVAVGGPPCSRETIND